MYNSENILFKNQLFPSACSEFEQKLVLNSPSASSEIQNKTFLKFPLCLFKFLKKNPLSISDDQVCSPSWVGLPN